MSIQIKRAWVVAIFAMLLAACGGGSSDAGPKASDPVKQSQVYAAGAFVEGLSYNSTPSNLSGKTDAKGSFTYRYGDTVTFLVGKQKIGEFKPNGSSFITNFALQGTNNIYDTAVVNLSVLLHFLDGDAQNHLVSGFLKIDPHRLEIADANTVPAALTDSNYLSQLRLAAQSDTPPLTVPAADVVMATVKQRLVLDRVQVAPYADAAYTFNEFKSTIALSALGSTDANGDPLSYQWFIDSKPRTSQAQIANPTSATATLGIDADDKEPYVFRLAVSDGVTAQSKSLTVNNKRTNIAGVYTSGAPGSVVAISDTGELWGYTTSPTPRAFTSRLVRGPLEGNYQSDSRFMLLSCDYTGTTEATSKCLNQGTFSAMLTPATVTPPEDNLPKAARSLNQLNVSDPELQAAVANSVLSASGLVDTPLLLGSLLGTYREVGNTSKNWILAKNGTFSLSETSADGKTVTLCATGDIKVDAGSQLLDSNGLPTKFMTPLKIEFKAVCKDGYEVGTSSTGFLFPDSSIGSGNAGYTFIGKNPAQTRMFMRRFIRQ